MDFDFSDEQLALRDSVRDLLAKHRTTPAPGDPEHDPALWRALAELGALGLPFAEDVGGMGASPVEATIVAIELGRAGVRTPYADALVAGSLLGDDSLLESLCEGTELIVPALYEPGRAWSLTPTVTADGESLSGVREPIPYAAAATQIVTTARTGDAVGVFVIADPKPVGNRLDLSSASARKIDGDATSVQRAVNLGIIIQAGEALGAMESALSLTVEYLKSRKQFGVPLMRFQTLTQRAADMYTSLELARSAVLHGAMTLTANPDDAAAASRVRVTAGKAGRHIGQEAIQLHGGIGMTAEYAVGHLTARLTAIEHSYGDIRHHLRLLAGGVSGYDAIDVLG